MGKECVQFGGVSRVGRMNTGWAESVHRVRQREGTGGAETIQCVHRFDRVARVSLMDTGWAEGGLVETTHLPYPPKCATMIDSSQNLEM